MTAMEPLVQVLLRVGITSPEAESLMRSLFVHQARDWLESQGDGAPPSDVRVSLVTGVHRNFVRQILSQPPKIPNAREGRGHLAGRLLRAWHTDPRYRDEGGNPRDLPERGPAPSFAALVEEHLSSQSAGVVLQELMRAGAVQSLSDHRVRVRSRTARRPGIHLDSVTAYGLQGRALLATLTAKLCDPQASAYFEATPVVPIPAARIPFIRDVVARRARSLLAGLEQELAGESKRKGSRGKKVQLSLAVMELAGPLRGRARRRGEESA